MTNEILNYRKKFKNSSPEEVLSYFLSTYSGFTTFSTSLGVEDQVITHLLVTSGLPFKIFTLDTGRLFQETYNILDLTIKKYNLDLQIFFPETAAIESMVRQHGINLFYDSLENRHHCCFVRKTEPLKRALQGMKVWITGLRKDQSVTRANAEMISWDSAYNLIKVNPLIHWSEAEVWDYIRRHHVPYNELHDQGYPSVGCTPCTRAVQQGEDIRAGRWWWELPSNKECGLHK